MHRSVEEAAGGATAVRKAGTVPGRPEGRRRPRLPAWMPWIAAPVVVLLLHAALPEPSHLRAQYQASGLALAAAPALAWWLTRRGALAHHAAAALSACVLPGLTLVSLHGSDWFFAGPTGDQSFRLEYANRFASDLGGLTDYTYDVPAFYSPGWFWTVGATSVGTQVPAWRVYPWVAVATMYLTGALAFWMWRRTCGVRLSAQLVTVTTIGLPAAGAPWLGDETLLLAGAYEPYGWLVALPLPALLTWFAMAGDGFSWRRGVALGAALGAAAWVYLLYTVVAVVGVLLIACWLGRSRARWLEVLVAGVTCLVVDLPWLGRFTLAWLAAGRPTSVSTTYVESESFVRLLVPAASPWLALAAAGALGLLVLRGPDHRRLRGCQAAAATVLVLGVVQLAAGQAARGLLFHRQVLVLGITLLAAGTLTLGAVGPALLQLARREFPGFPARRVAAAVLAVALLPALTAHADEWTSRAELRDPAFESPYPDGTLSPLAGPEARGAAAGRPSVDELAGEVRTVARLAGRPDTAPVLTDEAALLTLTDLFGYQQWWELYANPLARYPERRARLEQLAGQTPDDVVRTLQRDPDAPKVLVLRSDGDRPRYISLGWDPATGMSSPWSVTFPAGLFDHPAFVTRRVGDWTVAAVRGGGG